MFMLEASHSISNVLVKLGSAKMGALVNLSFKVSKAFSCSWPYLNTTSFFTMALGGATMVLFPPVDSNTFVRLYELRFTNLFASVPTFSFLRREHLKQRDKWCPRDRFHSDGQVAPSQCVRLPCRSATRTGVTAWVPTHVPIL